MNIHIYASHSFTCTTDTHRYKLTRIYKQTLTATHDHKVSRERGVGIASEAARYVHARTVYLGTALRPDVRTPDKSPGQTRGCLMVLGVGSPPAR